MNNMETPKEDKRTTQGRKLDLLHFQQAMNKDTTYQDDVEQFMMIGGQEIPCELSGPHLYATPNENHDQIQLYMDLITEEYIECLEAYNAGDVVEVADALADMVWVIMGMASSLDIDFNDVWQEVKRSNMSKFVDGVAVRNPETGKIMKPPTFSEPDLKTVLFGVQND
jgi:NTP pyrophosphatase (non-canonical NTP hydrolase)